MSVLELMHPEPALMRVSAPRRHTHDVVVASGGCATLLLPLNWLDGGSNYFVVDMDVVRPLGASANCSTAAGDFRHGTVSSAPSSGALCPWRDWSPLWLRALPRLSLEELTPAAADASPVAGCHVRAGEPGWAAVHAPGAPEPGAGAPAAPARQAMLAVQSECGSDAVLRVLASARACPCTAGGMLSTRPAGLLPWPRGVVSRSLKRCSACNAQQPQQVSGRR